MSSAPQQRSAVPLDQQSVLPTVRGLPWWGGVLVATVITGIGAAIDASNTDALGGIFKFCYLVGCVIAALAVRRRALFTAAAQPPLIAFLVGVITLYGLNSDQASSGLKSLIFKVLLPVADAFPWMLLTFLVTLGLVVARWYLTRDRSTSIGLRRSKGSSPKPSPAKTADRSPRTATKRAARPAATKARPAESGDRRKPASAAQKSRRPRPAAEGTADGAGVVKGQKVVDEPTTRAAAPTKRSEGGKRAAADRPQATKRRATAGAVQRAEAGELIGPGEESLGETIAPPATQARPTAGAAARRRSPSSAADHARYESATPQPSASRYPSTRARNRG
ncbi:DUF6542 domain-containing protein [Gordonia sp. SL306]|uniref:DUF6542 domain-containing protein n=1 Tax=Gordonia sp. SL306 TaxID=2995145 RepID=UPI00226F4FF1|nr:DUF6542 domain-containing protein [Gordonia sp. SL306]WAC56238.1 hypothetical protein OVA31_02935 [Gordonia sp. SL306]